MSALGSEWQQFTNIEYVDDDTIRVTLTDIGTGLDGSKFELTGVGGSNNLYEGLQLTPTRVTDDQVTLDMSEHGLTAPNYTWTHSGMVRVYQAPTRWIGSMISSYARQKISNLTSTGNTGTEGPENLTDDLIDYPHTLDGGSDHQLVATIPAGSHVDSVTLAGLKCDTGTEVRIRGAGDVYPVDVAYLAIEPRYAAGEGPGAGFPGVSVEGHNDNDPVPHFVRYVPLMVASTVTIDLLDPTDDIEISQLILAYQWQLTLQTKNVNWGSQMRYLIDADDVNAGLSIRRTFHGIGFDKSFQIVLKTQLDCTMLRLMVLSKGLLVFDAYPDADAKRWDHLIVGYLVGEVSGSEIRVGNVVELNILDAKKHEGI